MIMMTVTGDIRTLVNAKTTYHPFHPPEDTHSYDSPHAKEVTPYHAFDGMYHDSHYHHHHHHHPNFHPNHNHMPHFRNDLDDIPTRLVKISSATTMTTTRHFASQRTVVQLDPVSRLLQNSVDDMDILQNSIPCDCDGPKDDEDTMHSENTTTIGMTNRSILASSSTDECIYNEMQLRSVITRSPDNTPTKIEICSSYLPINASQPNPSFSNLQGILIRRKILDIHCIINDTHNCIMDAKSLSRFFIVYQSQVSLHNIVFMNGNGQDIAYDSGGAFFIQESTIEMVDCTFLNNKAGHGGGIILFDSKFHLRAQNDTHLSPIIINGNHATVKGGFLEAKNSVIAIEQYHFINNSAQYGGVFFIQNTRLILEGEQYHFINNSAQYGGVFFIQNTRLILEGTSVDNSLITTSTSTLMFRNNIASLSGGVLYGENSIIKLTNCQFMNNTAGQSGGGIFLFYSNLHLQAWNESLQTHLSIQDNHAAVHGGFLIALHSIITIDQCHFTNNRAQFGGVFFIYNTSLLLVGASDPTVPIVFEENIATDSGGVLYASHNSLITTSKDTFMFRNNIATFLGGVLFSHNSIIELTNCQFMNNTAEYSGGGIFLSDSNLHLKAWNESLRTHISIQDNRVDVQGGFLGALLSNITIEQYHFKSNSAQSGGVLFLSNTSLMLAGCSDSTSPIVFEDNIATGSGGVICADRNSVIRTSSGKFPIEFRSNKAQEVCHSFSAVDH
jgi:predicted outer membrane repeat protein